MFRPTVNPLIFDFLNLLNSNLTGSSIIYITVLHSIWFSHYPLHQHHRSPLPQSPGGGAPMVGSGLGMLMQSLVDVSSDVTQNVGRIQSYHTGVWVTQKGVPIKDCVEFDSVTGYIRFKSNLTQGQMPICLQDLTTQIDEVVKIMTDWPEEEIEERRKRLVSTSEWKRLHMSVISLTAGFQQVTKPMQDMLKVLNSLSNTIPKVSDGGEPASTGKKGKPLKKSGQRVKCKNRSKSGDVKKSRKKRCKYIADECSEEGDASEFSVGEDIELGMDEEEVDNGKESEIEDKV